MHYLKIMDSKTIYEWLAKQKYQTDYEETGEYEMYFAVDMPKILEDYYKWRQNNNIKSSSYKIKVDNFIINWPNPTITGGEILGYIGYDSGKFQVFKNRDEDLGEDEFIADNQQFKLDKYCSFYTVLKEINGG